MESTLVGKSYIEFIAAQSTGGGGSMPQTGDVTNLLFPILIMAAAFIAMAVSYGMQRRKIALACNEPAYRGQHCLSPNQEQPISRAPFAIIVICAALVLATAGFCFQSAFAGEGSSDVLPASHTATVDIEAGTLDIDEGWITCPQDDSDLSIQSVTLTWNDTVSDQEKYNGCENAEFTITGLGGTLYQGKADGAAQTPDQQLLVERESTEAVTISIQNLSMDLAEKLCGIGPAVTIEVEYLLEKEESPKTFVINVLDEGGEEFSGLLPGEFPIGYECSTSVELPNPKKYGYTFGGWFTNAECTGTPVTSLNAEEYTGDITLYAKWIPITATVQFWSNGGGGPTMESQVFTAGEAKQLPVCTYTPHNPDTQCFLGWNTRADGTGTSYANCEETSFDKNTTLYAQWIEPLRFKASSGSSTVTASIHGELSVTPRLVYTTDNGETWNAFEMDVPVNVSIDSPLFIRAESTNYSLGQGKGDMCTGNVNIQTTGKVGAYGNVMSLLDSSCKQKTVPDFGLTELFMESGITHAPNLPATTLGTRCYQGMFEDCPNLTSAAEMGSVTAGPYCYATMYAGCTSLKDAGTLPATELAEGCYWYLFKGCSALQAPPVIAATAMAEHCCQGMFINSGLTSMPELPATELAPFCYSYMFGMCSNLQNASALPATTLADHCYQSMFLGCNSLITAPTIAATTAAEASCHSMFSNCNALATASALPATKLAPSCYEKMFLNCPSLKSAPALPATKLESFCYLDMFSGCSALASAGALGAEEMAEGSCSNMFYGCGSLKTAPSLKSGLIMAKDCCADMFCKAGLTSSPTLQVAAMADNCCKGMFSGCKAMRDTGSINAPAMANGCCFRMFSESGITKSPAISVEGAMAVDSCREMFAECENMTEARKIAAGQMAESCCSSMFQGCSSLRKTPVIECAAMAKSCCSWMFAYCTALEEAVLSAASLETDCYSRMFYQCSNLSKITVHFSGWENFIGTTEWVMGVRESTNDHRCYFYGGLGMNAINGTSGMPESWEFKEI